MSRWKTNYYDKNFLPWDSKQPSSQLMEILEDEKVVEGDALELGCGTGSSLVYVAEKLKCRIIGIDLVREAVMEARKLAMEKLATEFLFCTGDVMEIMQLHKRLQSRGLEFSFDVCKDISKRFPERVNDGILDLIGLVDLPTDFSSKSASKPTFSFIYDCQFYHIFHPSPEMLLFYKSLLHPSGKLFMLTGNINSPDIGPKRLSKEELEEAFQDWKRTIREGQFDPTSHYIQQGIPKNWAILAMLK